MKSEIKKLKYEIRQARNEYHSRFAEHDTYIGYGTEYFIGNKFIGCTFSSLPDREKMMWDGKKVHIATTDIKVKNRTIPAGTEYWTMQFPLTGRRDK